MSLRSCYPVFSNLLRSIRYEKSQQICPCFTGTFKIKQRVASYSTETKPQEIRAVSQIYYGILTPQIKAVKFFSLSSSFVGLVAQPLLYKAVVSTGNVPIIIAAYSFIGFFTFVTPILLHMITKKYVTSLEYDEETDTYVAKTVNFFCITRQTRFKISDVRVPDVPGMFTTFIAKGKPLFLDPRLFHNPRHYQRIMGFDKPINFKLSAIPPTEKRE